MYTLEGESRIANFSLTFFDFYCEITRIIDMKCQAILSGKY